MITREILLRELIRSGYSIENGIRVWNLSKGAFCFINLEMAKAFIELQAHPRYEVIKDTEIKLLNLNIAGFLKSMQDSPFNLIDMSCTIGDKARAIISSLPKNMKLRYCPISVSDYLVRLSLENVKKENFQNVIDYASRITQDFACLDEVGAALRNIKYQKNVLLLLSSLISTFEINDYLFRLSQSMFPEDLLIIGNGIRMGQRFSHLETYQHPMFDRWLIHLLRQLGFKDEEVEYNARFAHNRLESYYKIKVDKKILYEKKMIEFRKNDEIIVAFQYKLFANELKDFCDMYFDNAGLVKDPNEEYALVLCKK